MDYVKKLAENCKSYSDLAFEFALKKTLQHTLNLSLYILILICLSYVILKENVIEYSV